MFTLAEIWPYILSVKSFLETWGSHILIGVMIMILVHMVCSFVAATSRRMATASSLCRWAVHVWGYAINVHDLMETSKKLFVGLVGLVELILLILCFVVCITGGILLYCLGIIAHPAAFMGWTNFRTTASSAVQHWGIMNDAQFVKQVNALVKLLDEVKQRAPAPQPGDE
jgi:hypothetical protein